MTWFVTAGAVLAAICGAIACAAGVQILANEAQGWILVLSRHLVRRAALRLPESHQLRYEEEWLAELEELASRPITSLSYSLWVLTKARRTSREIRRGSNELSNASPATLEPMSRITVGDVWEALDAVDLRPEGVGLGSAYFRLSDGRLLKFPNRGFFDHGIASSELVALFASWGARPTASGKYPMPPGATVDAQLPREPVFLDDRG